MYSKMNLINIKKTLFESPSTSHVGGHHVVDRFGLGSSRQRNRRGISGLEIKLRLRLHRLLRKKSKFIDEETYTGKINIQDDWIDWMLIWKKSAVMDHEQGKIADPTTNSEAAVLLNQAFRRRRTVKMVRREELSPEDAALIIQLTFKAHLIRKSNAIRGLKELASLNAKLKELRNWFYAKNSSYRNGGKFSQDVRDHQKFQKEIIVLLITIDAVEGATPKLRVAKKLMIEELEMMLSTADKFTDTRLKINAVSNATEMAGRGAMLLRLAFGRSVPGKETQMRRKEMGINEAASTIARSFREYMIRKADALRAHEELAMAEAKMEEVRGSCNNFGDDEERRMIIAEKTIVLLLTVDGIDGTNMRDRAWRRALVDELEAMLEIVDPQPFEKRQSNLHSHDLPVPFDFAVVI